MKKHFFDHSLRVKGNGLGVFCLFALLFTSLPLLGGQILEIPYSSNIPSFKEKFDPSLWNKALILEKFHTIKSKKRSLLPTKVYLLQDGRSLYGAIVAEKEDVLSLIKRQEKDMPRHPWALAGFEIFFGDNGNFAQLAFDYMGRLYKNFTAPVYSTIRHSRTKYVIRFALPFEHIIFVPGSDRIFKGNIYRKSDKEVSCFFPNLSREGSFIEMKDNGYFSLGRVNASLDREGKKYAQTIQSFVKAKSISSADGAALEKKIQKEILAGKKAAGDSGKVLLALKNMQNTGKEIQQAQLKSFRREFGNRKTAPFPANFHRGVPELWKPAKFFGKDYHFAMLAISLSNLEKAGIMKLPLFRDSVFRFWGEVAGKNMLPGGRHYETLKKYKNNLFMIGAPFGQLTVPTNHHAITSLFDPEYMKKFEALYKDRFMCAYMDESYFNGTGIFRKFLDIFKIPVPKNREEAYKAFQKLHGLTSPKPIRDIPTRNAWSTSRFTRKYVGNGAATTINHLVLANGDIMSGNENGECCGNNPSKMAVARGASRQFGKPFRNYQIFYGWCFLQENGVRAPGGLQCATGSSFGNPQRVAPALTPYCRWHSGHGMNGLYCGLSLERQKAVYLYPYLSGTGMWLSEGEGDELISYYDLDTIDKVDPMIVNLRDQKLHVSPIAKLHSHFYDNVVMKRDRGVAVTPIALVWDRAHGYLPLYFGNTIWDFFTPSEMEKTMMAVEKHLYKPLPHNKYYGTCPYGDIFDVITNDSKREFLQTYKVVYLVGDVTLDKVFANDLVEYVRRGGTLVINSENLLKRNPFSQKFLGVALPRKKGKSPATFSRLSNKIITEETPYSYNKLLISGAKVLAVTTDLSKSPAITVNSYGKGRVIVTAPENMKAAGSVEKMLNIFDDLMLSLRENVIDIKVETPMQYSLSRSKSSWIVYLLNNFGLPPGGGVFNKPPMCDRSKKATAKIYIPAGAGKVVKAIDWWSGKELKFKRDGKGCYLTSTLPGGESQAIEFVVK